ncbi:MO25-like protein 2 [Vitis vinifera]|uniref:MO25-like protein 2 n=1 Tax=Vitis vinifera TaxID=29760 RepID=A0A438KKK8_VITVI|nr:MO25-like protein 2 [Vitis vinifera]
MCAGQCHDWMYTGLCHAHAGWVWQWTVSCWWVQDSSKNIQISAFHIFKIFVANPNKPREIKVILAKNHERLLALLQSLSGGKGADDDQFEEEKELIIKEIQRVSRLPNLVQ